MSTTMQPFDARAEAHALYPTCPTFAANVGQPDEHSTFCDKTTVALQTAHDAGAAASRDRIAQLENAVLAEVRAHAESLAASRAVLERVERERDEARGEVERLKIEAGQHPASCKPDGCGKCRRDRALTASRASEAELRARLERAMALVREVAECGCPFNAMGHPCQSAGCMPHKASTFLAASPPVPIAPVPTTNQGETNGLTREHLQPGRNGDVSGTGESRRRGVKEDGQDTAAHRRND